MTLNMTDSEETGKLVENIYKNIVYKFEPGARQLIASGKAYLKALHGASAAAKQYFDAVSRLAKQAQHGTWEATGDIGSTLMQFADVYREIQEKHLTILKAFYVDVLSPLETNLEKDTKVIQAEQKRFQQQFRLRQDTYQKAVGIVKKQRKKTRTSRSSSNLEKELKNMQSLEEEKNKLDGFCEQSLRNALTQERIRYGFVLERQCSLAKHYLAFHSKGESLLQTHLDEWQDIAKTRDALPEHIQVMFPPSDNRHHRTPSALTNGLYGALNTRLCNGNGLHELSLDIDQQDNLSMTMRKARSVDASSMDLRSLSEAIDQDCVQLMNGCSMSMMIHGPPSTITRAKSEFNLSSSHQSLLTTSDSSRPRSMMVPVEKAGVRRALAKALYSYLSSGEHQLSFHEGDVIGLVGERNKGWQYGENMRTKRSGWFPVAYTEIIVDDDDNTPTSSPRRQRASIAIADFSSPTSFDPFSLSYPNTRSLLPTSASWASQPLASMNSKSNWLSASSSDTGSVSPPPPPPPPMPPLTPLTPSKNSKQQPETRVVNTLSTRCNHVGLYGPLKSGLSHHASHHRTPGSSLMHRSLTSPAPLRIVNKTTTSSSNIGAGNSNGGGDGATSSLHSSNDSGFGNDPNPPPQPDADYSDDDSTLRGNVFSTVKLRKTKTNDRSAPKIS